MGKVRSEDVTSLLNIGDAIRRGIIGKLHRGVRHSALISKDYGRLKKDFFQITCVGSNLERVLTFERRSDLIDPGLKKRAFQILQV